MKRLKVLVICGGGVFGVLPSHFLSMLPTTHQNLESVDVVAGCSIGGILAAAYSVGHTFAAIDDCFQKRAKDCFQKRTWAIINPLECPIYDSEGLYGVIKEMIGSNLLRDVKKVYPQLKIIVPALNATKDKPLVFQNITHQYDKVSLVDVAKMTSAAPSYFDCVEFEGDAIIDGGLLDVDGALTAVTTVKELLGIPFAAMDVLILGTGQDVDTEPLTVKAYRKLNMLGMATDVLRAYATLGNKEMSKKHLKGLGLHHMNYFNPVIINGALDDVKQIPSLVKEADKHQEAFLAAWHEWMTKR